MAIFDVTSYGAASDYNPGGGGNTDNTGPFKLAILACRAAGGGTVFVPAGGTGYLFNSRFDSVNFPNQVLPTLDTSGMSLVGETMGGCKLVLNQAYDLIRVGRCALGGYAEGFEVANLTIQAAKGFYGGRGIVVWDAVSADVHDINITDVGFQYGPNGNVFSIDPGTGFPYGALPRPGVTTDPRGAAYNSAAMGYIGVGFTYKGIANYKNKFRDSQVNGCGGFGVEVGVYNDNVNGPQGCTTQRVISARNWGGGFCQFCGDGSNAFIDAFALQNLGQGFLYLPPSSAPAAGTIGYSISITRGGADSNGDHGFWLWDQTSGGQTVGVNIEDAYWAASGTPGMLNVTYTGTWAQKNGILLQNGICHHFNLKNNVIIVNGNDGAEVCATVGPGIIWDNVFNDNAQGRTAGQGSGLYVNNNSLKLNIQRNIALAGVTPPYATNQGYGIYVGNTNITIPILHGNQAQGNVSGQYALGVTPTVNADNV